MVVFTCGYCGESVQKPKVEKHYLTKCRNRNPNLSCMDCFKDFLGQDYDSHTKCITEEERYSGKGFMAKEKKGEKKQNAWVEILQSVLDEQKSAPANVLRIIETVSKHNNTPRKKPKFVNFVKNVCGQKTNAKDIDQAWDLISVKLSALSNANNGRNQNQKNNESDSSIDCQKNDNKEENDNNITMERLEIAENGHTEDENGEAAEPEKKLSKKQLKEEKKRKKYEAELQSAEAPPAEPEIEETQPSKKGKKKKDRNNSVSSNVEENGTEKSKNKKRKRQDTVNGCQEVQETVQEVKEPIKEPLSKEQKKKLKIGADEEESVCLHDQNVAKSEDAEASNGKFNWHAVIISVLEKKGDEIPFKRLQKKVLSEYAEMTGQDIDDRIADKFIKKLKSAPNVRVDKNRVILIQ